MVTAAIRRHVVAMSPGTVDDSGRLIVARPRVPAIVVSASRKEAGNRIVNVQATKACAKERKSEIFTWTPLYSQCPAIQAIRKFSQGVNDHRNLAAVAINPRLNQHAATERNDFCGHLDRIFDAYVIEPEGMGIGRSVFTLARA